MVRRNATTLTEVLIAIFIMGIGLMAILALFPLGAVQMAQALKDQRAAEAAANAASMARIIWKQACEADPNFPAPTFRAPATPSPTPTPYYWPYPRSRQRFVLALDDPNFHDNPALNDSRYPGIINTPPNIAYPLIPPPTYLADMVPLPLTGPQANQSSYAVYVDPVGWLVNRSNLAQQQWVGYSSAVQQPTAAGNKLGLIARRPLYMRDPTSTAPAASAVWWELGVGGPLAGLQRVARQVSLMDDMSFNFDGTPDLDNNPQTSDVASVATTPVQRVGRYSWAYMFRRVRNKDFRSEVDATVVVYSGRTLDVPTDERSYLGSADWDSRIVTLNYSGTRPAIRRGSWILDSTVFNSNGVPDPQARFYRVVNVDDSAANVLTLELQTPIAPGGPRPPSARVFTVLDNVVEVFQIGFISPSTPPRNITDDHEY